MLDTIEEESSYQQQQRMIEDEKEKAAVATTTKVVTFANVEIREYARCLGNNPTTYHDGPSLSIDWQYQSVGVLNINDYENVKQTIYTKRQLKQQRVAGVSACLRYPRYGNNNNENSFSSSSTTNSTRCSRSLTSSSSRRSESSQIQKFNDKHTIDIIPGKMRRNIIQLHTNCTDEEIQLNMKESSKVDRQRQLSIEDQDYELFYIILESIQRKFKRIFIGTSSSSSNSDNKNKRNNNRQKQESIKLTKKMKKKKKKTKMTRIVPSSIHNNRNKTNNVIIIEKDQSPSSSTIRQIVQNFVNE